eukprot:2736534-Rhodomonas_salina.1
MQVLNLPDFEGEKSGGVALASATSRHRNEEFVLSEQTKDPVSNDSFSFQPVRFCCEPSTGCKQERASQPSSSSFFNAARRRFAHCGCLRGVSTSEQQRKQSRECGKNNISSSLTASSRHRPGRSDDSLISESKPQRTEAILILASVKAESQHTWHFRKYPFLLASRHHQLLGKAG